MNELTAEPMQSKESQAKDEEKVQNLQKDEKENGKEEKNKSSESLAQAEPGSAQKVQTPQGNASKEENEEAKKSEKPSRSEEAQKDSKGEAEKKQEEKKQKNQEKAEFYRLLHLLRAKEIELKLYTSLLEKKKKEEKVRPLPKLLRIKKNLEFTISVEARTKEDERNFIKEIQKLEDEIKKARAIKAIEKKILLIGKDIEDINTKLKELKKTMRKARKKASGQQSKPPEFRLEDVITIKKSEKKKE